jgi:hypothetical protein
VALRVGSKIGNRRRLRRASPTLAPIGFLFRCEAHESRPEPFAFNYERLEKSWPDVPIIAAVEDPGGVATRRPHAPQARNKPPSGPGLWLKRWCGARGNGTRKPLGERPRDARVHERERERERKLRLRVH